MEIKVLITVTDENSSISDILKRKELAYVSVHGDARLVEDVVRILKCSYKKVS